MDARGAPGLLPLTAALSAADIFRESFPLAVYPLLTPPDPSTVVMDMALIKLNGSPNKAEMLESQTHSCNSTFRHQTLEAEHSSPLNRNHRTFCYWFALFSDKQI